MKIPSSTGGRRRTTKSKKCKLPLLGELSRSSRDSFESESDSKESRDDRLNSPKNGNLHFLDFVVRRRPPARRRRTTKSKKCKLPLFGELSRSSRDSFESDSDSKESRDDRLNSPKNGNLHFFDFVVRRRPPVARRQRSKKMRCFH